MVASGEAAASRAGADILKRGGNAVDAAVAVGLTLAVTLPEAGNLGGGGFMLIHRADGKTIIIDYRETAPALASRDMYLDSRGDMVPKASEIGYRAVGVPGTVAGLALALEKYGTMKWRDVIEPARRLAAEGFPVSHRLERSFREKDHLERLERFPESRRVFLKDGAFYAEGEILKQPELAATLARLQEEGPREFYEGRTAQFLADAMKSHGGLITREDLKNYKPVERQPLRGSYRGYEIVTMPPPSSGGVALLEILNMLESYDVGAMAVNSSRKDHLLIEAMRRAFADRADLLGDTDFVKVPVERLISKSYAAALAKTIDPERATASTSIKPGILLGEESHQTTHFSVVDGQGNAVSNTYTLNLGYGSGVTVPGAGFLLNDEMDDFTSKPGVANAFGLIQSQANAIAPHKRPLSAMTPTVVLKDGKLFLVIGSPGGPTIISTVLQVLVNVIDHHMNVRQAIEAPRLHHQWLPDMVSYERYGLPADVRSALEAKGHHFFEKPGFRGKGSGYWGDAEGIMIEPRTGIRLGACDPRSADALVLGN
jgi:gamma-glutamyltranspeptidase/glutathione hydrolase